MSDEELPAHPLMSSYVEEQHNSVLVTTEKKVVGNKTFTVKSVKIRMGEVLEPIDRPRQSPLIYVGTYNTETGIKFQGLTDSEDWCGRMQQILIPMGIVSCARLDPVGVNNRGCRMSLELFVRESDLHLSHDHTKGIFIGPALAGWIETLQLPPAIKKEACAMFRHVKNKTVTSVNTGDPVVETMRQFLTLLQHMYKMKMTGGSLEGLKTLIPIFLLLANKL